MRTPTCDFCDQPFTLVPHYAHPELTPGYAIHDGGRKACYACCAWLDTIAMRQGRDVGLYHTKDADGRDVVTNFPGTLVLPVTSARNGQHFRTGKRTTYHFQGPNGRTWTGTEYHGPCSGNLLRIVRPLAS